MRELRSKRAALATTIPTSSKASKRRLQSTPLCSSPKTAEDSRANHHSRPKHTSIHSLPNEILVHVLNFAVDSFGDDAWGQQKQRMTQSVVCKSWHQLQGGRDDYAFRTYKQARRLARAFNVDGERADRARKLVVNLKNEQRPGTKQMVANILWGCPRLEAFELMLMGRDQSEMDADSLGVPLYDALMEKDLQEFRLEFTRAWTGLTLGGHLATTLAAWPRLKVLHLPKVFVPKIDATFPFSPSLTSLSLHLLDTGCVTLLEHLLKTSATTLLHLFLTLHPTASTPDFISLSTLLAPVAPQLSSFGLAVTATHTHRLCFALPTTITKIFPSLSSLLPLMARLSTLTLSSHFSPPFALFSALPRLRHFTIILGYPNDLVSLATFLSTGTCGLTHLHVSPSRAFPPYLRNQCSEDMEKLKSVAERVGIVVTSSRSRVMSLESDAEELDELVDDEEDED